jgi:hypothetical protein
MQERQIKNWRANKMGKEKMLDLLESRIGNAERTFQNNLSNDAYSNGRPTLARAA